MKNLRGLSKNALIHHIRAMEKGISQKCLDCVNGNTRYKCETTDCGLFLFRPWEKNKQKLPQFK